MADRDMRRAKKEIVDREELHCILDEAMVMLELPRFSGQVSATMS